VRLWVWSFRFLLALHCRRRVSPREAGSLPAFFTGVAGCDESTRSVSLFRLSSLPAALAFMSTGASGASGGGGGGGWPHSSFRLVGVLSAGAGVVGSGGSANPEMPREWARERKEEREGPATDTSPVYM
jgi:hypothetical protein